MGPIKNRRQAEQLKLNKRELDAVEYKIKLEACLFMRHVVYISLLVNGFVGFFLAFTFYHSHPLWLVTGWYSSLIIVNLINVLWAYYSRDDTPSKDELNRWWQGFFIIIVSICIVWGSVGAIFFSNNVQQQVVVFSILSAAVISFTFPTSINLKLGLLCIFFLLTPTILTNYYIVADFFITKNIISIFYLVIASTLLALGVFLMGVCYIGHKTIIKVLKLGYENAMLREKLEVLNSSLEKRVQNRTKELEKSLKLVTFHATHDLLTELPNERLLIETVSTSIEKGIKNHSKFIIASFSIKNMATISQSVGHKAVEKITKLVSQRLINFFEQEPNCFISLSRQDSFVVLIDPIPTKVDLEVYIQNLFKVLDDPVFINNHQLKLTGKIGVSLFPAHGLEADTLLTCAEAARHNASEEGGNSLFIYDEIVNEGASRKLALDNLIYSVIENNELLLQYQPIVNTKTGKVVSAEALIRWKSPLLGLVPPNDFIPIAEANGMIIPIGQWVLSTACHQLKKWHELGFDDLKISVNLSAKELFARSDFVESLSKLLKDLNLNPKYLELELTESEVFHHEMLPLIDKLIELGVSFSLDDFGTGYSEFVNLKLFKVNTLKIDKVFTDDIGLNADSKKIVNNTLALATSMNIECIAEGVETKEQIDLLDKEGCYLIQGYYYSKPLGSDDFLNFLKDFPNK